MIGGSVVVVACLLTLGWTAELVGLFISDEATVRRSMVNMSLTMLIGLV